MSTTTEQPHCETCTCARRAPVQWDHCGVKGGHGPGTVTWAEHIEAWSGYARRYGSEQGAERIAQRGGFSYGELTRYLGHEPSTWRPASQ